MADATSHVDAGGSNSNSKPAAEGDVGDRHKEFEKAALTQRYLRQDQPHMARIDGHCFSTFTKAFAKPYDERIAFAMRDTAGDLLTHFQAATAYTFSDEITLCFPALSGDVPGQCLPFNGKVMKTSTLMAGYASVRFVHNLRRHVEAAHARAVAAAADSADGGDGAGAGDFNYARISAMLNDPHVYFDARVFNVPARADVLENLVWRSCFDCRRNSVSGLARVVLGKRGVHGVGTKRLLAMLEERGRGWGTMPPHFRYGTFAKKERVTKRCMDRKTGEMVEVQRSAVALASFGLKAPVLNEDTGAATSAPGDNASRDTGASAGAGAGAGAGSGAGTGSSDSGTLEAMVMAKMWPEDFLAKVETCGGNATVTRGTGVSSNGSR